MAKFTLELPTDLIKDFEMINNNAESIFKSMVKAGAEAVQSNIKANVPAEFKTSDIMNCLTITKPYNVKDGVACKVAFYGYFKNKQGVITPAPLVANVFEYGRSAQSKRGAQRKKPYLRKSFRQKQLEEIMLKEQRRRSKGLL